MIIDSGIATSSLNVSGSFTVVTGSSIEFQVTNTGVKIGNIITDIHPVTGSLTVSGSITGSLLGTASFSTTASFALNAGGASGDKITTGSITASVNLGAATFQLISGSSTFLYVSSSGDVGIGITSPAARLHISSSAIIQTGSSGTNLTLYNTAGGAGVFTSLDFQQYSVNNLYTTASAASIRVIDDGAFSGHITFRTKGNTATSTQTERVRIEASTGNVGIGTTVPAAKLQVSGTVNVVNFKGSGSVATSSIFTVDGAAGRLFSVNDSLSGSLFSVNTIAGLPVMEAFSDNTVRIGQYGQRVLFVSQSRVGIGKETALNALLDVSGSVTITGSLNLTGSITQIGNITTTGSLNVSGSITGSLLGTASFATTASFALNAGAGGGSTAITFNRQTASYTLALTDANKIVEMNSASANTVTVPSSSVVNFTTGSQITVTQYGSGQTSFTTGSTNVTIRSANSWLKINARYGAATLTKVGNDEWYLIGNLNA